jgi:uncharacterized protein (TIGR02597 family)
MKLTCLGLSDTIVSAPLARLPEYEGRGTGLDVIAGSSGKIAFSGTPFTAGQFKYVAGVQPNTYYAFVASGSKEGDYFTITDNDTNSVQVDLNGDTLAGITAGTTVKIVPFWTLATLFPNGQGVTPTSGFTPATQILLPDTASAGNNLTAAGIYTYSAASGTWSQFGSEGPANDTILYPDNYFTVRNNAPAMTTIVVNGAVVVNKQLTALTTNAATKQDNFVAVMRPTPMSLNESGLIASGAFRASSGFTTSDQLFVFDNTVAQLNKAAAASYTYSNGAWRRFGVTGDAGADIVFTPGAGVIIRKARNSSGATSVWTSPATLPN